MLCGPEASHQVQPVQGLAALGRRDSQEGLRVQSGGGSRMDFLPSSKGNVEICWCISYLNLQFESDFFFSAQYFAGEQLFLFYVMVWNFRQLNLKHQILQFQVLGGVETAEKFNTHIKLTR